MAKLVHSKATADLYCAEVALCSEALGPAQGRVPEVRVQARLYVGYQLRRPELCRRMPRSQTGRRHIDDRR